MNTDDGEFEERLRRYYQSTLGPPPDPEQVRKQVTMRLEQIGDHIGDNQTGEMRVFETSERSPIQRSVVTRDILPGAFSPGPRRSFVALVATLLVLAMAGTVFGWVASHRGAPRGPTVTDSTVLPGTGPRYTVTGLQMLSATNGWAIVAGAEGSRYQTGIVLHFDGYRWSVVKTLAHTEPLSISMISATEGWIAGNTLTDYSGQPTASAFQPNEVPFLVHYIGGRWVQVSPPLGVNGLQDPCVTMVTANFGWAVVFGSDLQYRIALYHDGIWTDIDFPATLNASCATVRFTSPTDGWAAGGSSGFLHYTNGHWLESTVSPPVNGGITNIEMLSSSAGWAIGAGNEVSPVLFQYNGVSWRQVTVPESGSQYPGWISLSVVSPTEFWAVGVGFVPGGLYATPPSDANVGTYLLHFTNGQWSYMKAPAGFSLDSSCAIISANDVWIGGRVALAGEGNYEAALAHYRNGHWTLYK